MKALIFKSPIGNSYRTVEGYELTIIQYTNFNKVTIQFNDERGAVKENQNLRSIIKGVIKNPYHAFYENIGFLGEGLYSQDNNNEIFCRWRRTFERCYNEKVQKRQPTYKNVTVCKEWHNFQNFAQWHEKNYNPEIMKDWEFDKDILSTTTKIYSPETCCFVPSEINCLFRINPNSPSGLPTGVRPSGTKYKSIISRYTKDIYLGTYDTIQEARKVYLKAKKEYIQEVAYRYKDQLPERTYEAILNFPIEIL